MCEPNAGAAGVPGLSTGQRAIHENNLHGSGRPPVQAVYVLLALVSPVADHDLPESGFPLTAL